MKTMLCSDLGGVCDQELSAESWDDMVHTMTKHVIENHQDLAIEMEKMHINEPDRWNNEMKPKWEATSLDTDTIKLDSQSIT